MIAGNQKARLSSVRQREAWIMWENGQEASMVFVLSLLGPAGSTGDSSLSAFKCIQIPFLSPNKNTHKNLLANEFSYFRWTIYEWMAWFSANTEILLSVCLRECA